MKFAEIQNQAEQAAEAISTLPIEKWAGWMVYILEMLDEKADDSAFCEMLETLRESITTRLEEESW